MTRLASLFIGEEKGSKQPNDTVRTDDKKTNSILFVDDEENVLKAMRRIFRRENYKLLMAQSGQEALELLKKEPAHVVISDPQALDNAKTDLNDYNGLIEYEVDPYKAAHNAHAIAILTEWDLYKTLDYKSIYEKMEKPAFIFDGRNILDHNKLFEIGFNVYPLGMPHLIHFKEA